MRNWRMFILAALMGLQQFGVVFAGDQIHDKTQQLAPMWANQSPTIAWWAPEIYFWAKEYDLNPNVIAVLMQVESCGKPEAESQSAAQGLFQVMPFNFPADLQDRMQDPEVNAKVGLEYLNYTLGLAGGDIHMAFAAYNGGPSVLSKPTTLWSDETFRYYYWTFILEDALANADNSARLAEWHLVDGGGTCGDAKVWQDAHPRDKTIQQVSVEPGVVTLDFPPVVWVVILMILALIVRRWVSWNWGNRTIGAIVTIVVILWFPLNLFHQEIEYENLVFRTRAWFDSNEAVDQVLDYIQKGEDLGLPIPELVTSAKSKYESTKDFALNFSLWISRDPVLTPVAMWVSHQVWVGLQEDPNTHVNFADSNEFAAPFDAPVQVRIVKDGNGETNHYGIHGNFCFACQGLQSWLGTDVRMDPDQYFYSPIEGVVDRVIVDGGIEVGGSSVWIVGESTRVAVLHLLSEDAMLWQKGQNVSKGQSIGRQDPGQGHVHVILELQNPDGSWGDYPLVLVTEKTGVPIVEYETSTYNDLYVPSVEDLIQRSRRLDNERQAETP